MNSRGMTKLFAAGVVAALTGAFSPATANQIPILTGASSTIVLNYNNLTGYQSEYQTFSGYTMFSRTSRGATASGTASLEPNPTISVSASVSGNDQYANAQQNFSYYFEYLSSGPTTASIIFNANGTVSPSLTTPNQASLQINSTAGGALLLSAGACTSNLAGNCSGLPFQPSFSIAAHITVNTTAGSAECRSPSTPMRSQATISAARSPSTPG